MWEMVVAPNWSAMVTCPTKWLSGSATKMAAAENSDKDEEGGPLKEDEMGSTSGAAVEHDLRRGSVVDDMQLGGERGGPRDVGCGRIRGLMRRKKSFLEFTDS
jgi:hypothetical protein